jgi:hypothetical protein
MILGWSSSKIVSGISKISIFSNGGHLGWGVCLSDTNLEGIDPGTIPTRFGLIWLSGFRGEDLNVICYQNMPNLHNRYTSALPILELLSFLAHLAFRPCKLLPSLFVRPSTFHILIFSSETTGPISAERKISHKKPVHMLNYSLPCSCS